MGITSNIGANINEGPRIHDGTGGCELGSQRGGVKQRRKRRKGAHWGRASSEKGAKRMEDPGECDRRWRLCACRKRENRHKIEDRFLLRISTTQLKHRHHHQHRHVHLQAFRCNPLRRCCTVRRDWSALPSSFVPRQHHLTSVPDQGAKRNSDGGISFRSIPIQVCISRCLEAGGNRLNCDVKCLDNN